MMFIKTYLITLPIFLAIDMVWLGVVAKKFYAQHLGFLMKTNVNFVAAGLFYLLFVVGLVVFAVLPAFEKNSWTQALFLGALLGFISYSTYDLTNLATIKDWPLVVTIVDMVWGTVLGALVSLTSYFIVRRFWI